MKKANKNIIDTLNELKKNLEIEHSKLKAEFDKETDKAKKDDLYKSGESVVKNHKLINSYLNKYHTLFTLIYNENDNDKKNKLTKQIDDLENELKTKYNIKVDKTSKVTKEEPKKEKAPLEKGKKYTVIDKKKVAWNSAGLTINSLFGLGKSALTIISAANAVNYFTTLAFPVSLIGGVPMLALAGVFAYGTIKSVVKSINNVEEIKSSIKM